MIGYLFVTLSKGIRTRNEEISFLLYSITLTREEEEEEKKEKKKSACHHA